MIVVLFITAVTGNSTAASDEASDIQKLNAKILELQQQIIALQKKHESEIEALRQRIDKFAVEAD